MYEIKLKYGEVFIEKESVNYYSIGLFDSTIWERGKLSKVSLEDLIKIRDELNMLIANET